MKQLLRMGLASAALLAVSGYADAAFIVIKPGCTLPSAINAANLDRPVLGCTAGRGADIIFKPNSKVPFTTTTTYPAIKSTIIIRSASNPSFPDEPGFIGFDAPNSLRLFNVTTGGSLTMHSANLFGQTIGVNGGSLNLTGALLGFVNSCLITATNDAKVTLTDTAIRSSTCGINLAKSKLTLTDSAVFNRLTIRAGTVGIRATDSTVTANSSLIYNHAIGVDLIRSSFTYQNVSFVDDSGQRPNTQDIRAGVGSTVVAPPATTGPAPAPAPIDDSPTPAPAPIDDGEAEGIAEKAFRAITGE